MAGGSIPPISNVKRAKWKPVIDYSKNELKNKSVHRAQIISPSDVNKKVLIENGITSKSVKITADHVGHRAGEFFQTKKRVIFKNKKS